MRKFGINLRGRIKNFNLPKNQPLIPLFEAIVNSIHAIDERKKLGEDFNSYIMIKIIRSCTKNAGCLVRPPVGQISGCVV